MGTALLSLEDEVEEISFFQKRIGARLEEEEFRAKKELLDFDALRSLSERQKSWGDSDDKGANSNLAGSVITTSWADVDPAEDDTVGGVVEGLRRSVVEGLSCDVLEALKQTKFLVSQFWFSQIAYFVLMSFCFLTLTDTN